MFLLSTPCKCTVERLVIRLSTHWSLSVVLMMWYCALISKGLRLSSDWDGNPLIGQDKPHGPRFKISRVLSSSSSLDTNIFVLPTKNCVNFHTMQLHSYIWFLRKLRETRKIVWPCHVLHPYKRERKTPFRHPFWYHRIDTTELQRTCKMASSCSQFSHPRDFGHRLPQMASVGRPCWTPENRTSWQESLIAKRYDCVYSEFDMHELTLVKSSVRYVSLDETTYPIKSKRSVAIRRKMTGLYPFW